MEKCLIILWSDSQIAACKVNKKLLSYLKDTQKKVLLLAENGEPVHNPEICEGELIKICKKQTIRYKYERIVHFDLYIKYHNGSYLIYYDPDNVITLEKVDSWLNPEHAAPIEEEEDEAGIIYMIEINELYSQKKKRYQEVKHRQKELTKKIKELNGTYPHMDILDEKNEPDKMDHCCIFSCEHKTLYLGSFKISRDMFKYFNEAVTKNFEDWNLGYLIWDKESENNNVTNISTDLILKLTYDYAWNKLYIVYNEYVNSLMLHPCLSPLDTQDDAIIYIMSRNNWYIKIKTKCKELKRQNHQLEHYITHLTYKPGGCGYMDARDHFKTATFEK